ncbi:putative glycosyl transferases group 1 [Lyophyllum shimeji]|uniref:Chitobiosyldiphosphodolichol beta-mannosyltransferase n=1 Tax=Lyophyllum shimeji TaxID=47721 RepID=A0A9P3PJQ3_LYOSH|nr:putative glycosyl transferases group 1 [Lyophyllum shimeji]
MMYHAQSFAENEFATDIIGYGGSKPIPALERLPKVHIHHLPELPKFLRTLPFIIFAPIKIVHQIASILFVLLVRISKPPEFILVQNPPTIPTLALVWLVGRIRGSKVIIDWHNLGYSILALRVGKHHPFVKLATWFEGYFGKTAYAHLFVTHAMRDFLVKKWDLQGRKLVLQDRPPRHFHRASAQEVHELFLRLEPSLTFQASLHGFLPSSTAPYSTPFTHTATVPSPVTSSKALKRNSLEYHHGFSSSTAPPIPTTAQTYMQVQLPTQRPDRPALLVSSTSWTPDEDFGILLGALELYEARAQQLAALHDKAGVSKPAQETVAKLPKMLVIITGKGSLRERYMNEVAKLQKDWQWVRCVSLWLEAEDYPILLGSADLGVCLHSSSSALDLPMKVVDMFGCGLPVCALDFACLDELVKDGVNGRVFKNSAQLAEQIEDLLTGFPDDASRLEDLRASLARTSQPSLTPPHVHPPHIHTPDDKQWRWGTWEENWARTVRPLILRDVNR